MKQAASHHHPQHASDGHCPSSAPKPLTGVRVIEMGQLIAGPFAGHMLAYFGAEVIKIEAPGNGDPLRHWRALDDDGTSFWWRSMARNKKSVTVNLNAVEGRELVRELINNADVLIENFRPGKMESWELGPSSFQQSNPALVYTRVSGYGQDGPYHTKPGFASACEAMGGFRYVNGFADRPPVRPNLSMGDTLAGMHAVIGTLLALVQRSKPGGEGQVVDVSILESVYGMLESVVPEYSGAGLIREPSGSTLTGIVPTNTYRCADGRYVVIGGNGDSIFKRLMTTAGRDDMANNPAYVDNPGRVAHEGDIDEALTAWTQTLPSDVILQKLEDSDVPSAPIYSVKDMFEDPHFAERGLFETVHTGTRELTVPTVHPRLDSTPGSTEWAGPELGQHTHEVLQSLNGMTPARLAQLERDGVIGTSAR